MVTTRHSKGQSPSQSQDTENSAESPASSSSLTQSSPNNSRKSKRKRAKSPTKGAVASPASDPESPKSDSSTREKMRQAKIEEPGEGSTPPEYKRRKSSESSVDEMTGIRSGELSPGAKGRKRVHDEIAASSKDSKNSTKESDDRPPSRAANGEPLGKKLRETPSPPRESTVKGTSDGAPIEKSESVGLSEPEDTDNTKTPSDVLEGQNSPSAVTPDTSCEIQAGDVNPKSDDLSNNDRNEGVEPRPKDILSSDAPAPQVKNVTESEDVVPSQKLAANDETVTSKKQKEPTPEDSIITDEQSGSKKEPPKPSGGFGNTSAASPFSTLAATTQDKKPSEEAGTSKFEASGFSNFSKSSSASAFGVASTASLAPSPFGAPPTGSNNVFSQMSADSKSSVFPGPSTGSVNVFAKMSSSTSGSSFGSTGFGGSGFGSSTPSVFGSTSSPFGGNASKSVFGAPAPQPLPKAQPLDLLKASDKPKKDEDADEEDDNEDGVSEAADNGENDASKTNAPAKHILKSGEEGYDIVFQARGKLFELSGGAWKERGIGTVKVLTPQEEYPSNDDDDEEATKKAAVGRIVMRQEGVGRLILNTNIFKNMLVSGKQTAESVVQFMAMNSVTFAESNEKKPKGDDASDSGKTEAEPTETDEKKPNDAQKNTLRNYILRLKGQDLAKNFREHVEESYP